VFTNTQIIFLFLTGLGIYLACTIMKCARPESNVPSGSQGESLRAGFLYRVGSKQRGMYSWCTPSHHDVHYCINI